MNENLKNTHNNMCNENIHRSYSTKISTYSCYFTNDDGYP